MYLGHHVSWLIQSTNVCWISHIFPGYAPPSKTTIFTIVHSPFSLPIQDNWFESNSIDNCRLCVFAFSLFLTQSTHKLNSVQFLHFPTKKIQHLWSVSKSPSAISVPSWAGHGIPPPLNHGLCFHPVDLSSLQGFTCWSWGRSLTGPGGGGVQPAGRLSSALQSRSLNSGAACEDEDQIWPFSASHKFKRFSASGFWKPTLSKTCLL